MQGTLIKLIASSAALVLLVIHLVWSEVRIDTITLGLLVIGILPWIASIFETLELPGGWKVTFRKLQVKQEYQQAEIATLKFLISHFLTEAELIHLTKLSSNERFPFQISPYFENELRHLRALGFINSLTSKGIRTLNDDKGGDVKNHFEITERGKEYLKLRQQSALETLMPNNKLTSA